MSGDETPTLLPDLMGAEVESVVFVRDYLQLTLYLPESSPRLTFYAWPAIGSPKGVDRSIGDSGYRDALCSLIDSHVTQAEARPEVGLAMQFDDGQTLTLRPAWADVAGPEIAMLHMNDEAGSWDIWRPGEGPFERDTWA